MEKILYCDFDGTLIREDSEGKLVSYLMKTGYFKFYHYFFAGLGRLINIPRRFFFKGNIIKAWSAAASSDKKTKLINDFWEKNIENFSINQDVVSKVRSFDGRKILLTGSDQELVSEFLNRTELSDLVDEVIGSKTDRSGIRILQHPYGKDKCSFLKKNIYKAGIANEMADIFFLLQCDEAYIVKGDPALELEAEKRNWRVI